MDSAPAIRESDRRLGIPDIAEIIEGAGKLPKVRITSAVCTGEMYLHGAQVTSWKPTSEEEVLFLSAKSRFQDGQAIRGGIPVCFPWFGGKADDPKAPSHGFVRTKLWHLDSITQAADGVTVSMSTESNEATKKWWPADFRAVLRATFAKHLSLEFTVTNTGETSLRFEEALHAYFHVGNVEVTRARIPDALHYLDKTDANRQKTQLDDITIGSETDRVYLHTVDEIQIQDQELHRRVLVTKENSSNTVVWNPWTEKARAMFDLEADEWLRMLCIEPSNVGDSTVQLAPRQRHTMRVLVRVVDFDS